MDVRYFYEVFRSEVIKNAHICEKYTTMIVIGDKLVSDDLVAKDFVCNLSACKGQCCVLGDEGAPITEEEASILDDIYEDVEEYLTPEGIKAIKEQGKFIVGQKGALAVTLIEDENCDYDKACAFVHFDEKGIAKCGIEIAHYAGKIDFLKPVSCHLYPIRINEYEGFEAVNYEKWDICDPACTLGKELQVPVYRFLKDSLIRKYGEDFYEELTAAADYMNKKTDDSNPK